MSPTSARWIRVKQIFTDALAVDPAERALFLDRACAGDVALRQELDSLLASHDEAGDRFEQPASGATAIAEVVANLGHRSLHLPAGTRLGPYEIVAPIGAGGMGEVYQARDTRLDRTVAIKVLPPHIAADPTGRERFEREARAVAALNHPHICTLHDVGRDGDVDYLVMEYLDGETLAARLLRGRLPLEQAMDYACEIASALEKAHGVGIVHRDLKPGNIMLTRAGTKLLDFGLAKGFRPVVAGGSPTFQPGSALTTPGRILGTLHYMAPEQLEGKDEDASTDFFAFGCVLHEMVTGARAFDGGSSAAVVAAIMTARPALISDSLPTAPPALEYIVDRCLAKSRDDRWQTARDLLADLKQTRDAARGARPSGPARRQPVTGGRPTRARLAWVLAGVAAAIAVGLGLRTLPPAPAPVLFLSILPPADGFDLSPDPVVSPDGKHIAFKAQDASHRTHIWLKTLGASDASVIAGTEDTDYNFAPFWSPDSRSLAFFSRGRLKRVDVSGGGTSQVLAAAREPRGGTWLNDGRILFNGDTQNLFVVQASGASPAAVVPGRAGEVRLFPRALPDGRHYLFTSRNVAGQGQGVYVGTLDSLDANRVSDAWSPAAYASGHLLFVRQTTLFAQPFDLAKLALSGEPHRVADRIGLGYGNPLTFAFSVSSAGGIIAYWTGTKPETQLTWFDRSGARIATAGEAAAHSGFSLSFDARRAVLERMQAASSTIDLWLLDMANPVGSSRLTLDGRSSSPIWAPDGQRLLVMQRDVGLFLLPTEGAGGVAIAASQLVKWPADWSSDGRVLAFTTTTADGSQLWTTRAEKGSQPVLYRQAPFLLASMQFSPDGHWIAYMSDESGQREVYVDSYPTPRSKLRISTGGGGWPKWRRDGKELYYLAFNRMVMVVAVQESPAAISVAVPRALFEGPAVLPDENRGQFTPNLDGTRFLFNARVDNRRPVGLDVIANWPALLDGR